MASLSAIRTALKETIEAAVTDLHGYANMPESVNLPAVVVLPTGADFDVAMGRGTDTYTFNVLVLVSRRDDTLAQFDLDDYVTGAGDKSIRQAIFDARSLGLTDTDAHVTGMSSYGAGFEVGGVVHVGAVLACQVHTKGTE